MNSPFQKAFPEVTLIHDLNSASFWKKHSGGRIQARYISPFAIILHNKGVYPLIGEGTWIGHFCIIDGSQAVVIGKNCEISCGVHIYSHTTHRRCTIDGEKEVGRVEIRDNVFIGANSVISLDCYLGSHSMIGPLSFLKPGTKVHQYDFFAGCPAEKKGVLKR